MTTIISPHASQLSSSPRRSDVILSSRWVHYQAVGGPSPLDTWGAVDAFNATRVEWCYTANSSFVSAARHRGLTGVTLATNANNPDDGDDRCNALQQPRSCSWSVGRVLNIDGRPLASPPVFRRVAHGCVNSPAYMNITLKFVETLKAAGATGIQHDDAAMNGEAVSWNGGNLSTSGCYCPHCMAKFTATLLRDNSSATALVRAYNITRTWSYSRWLLQRPIANANTAPDRSPLRGLFVAFQQRSTEEYVWTLRNHLDHVDSDDSGSDARSISLSSNNGGAWTSPYQLFDYGVGELEVDIGTQMTLLRRLHAMFVADVPQGKYQVVTMPKGLTLQAWYTPEATVLIRTAIAVSYALGGHMLVPWDAEIAGGRFYGNASQFGDLYSFVRRHADVLDHCADQLQTHWLPSALTEQSASNYRLQRLAVPLVSGRTTVPAGLRECQSLCDRLARHNASACVGVQLLDRPYTHPGTVGECTLAGDLPGAKQGTFPVGLQWYRRVSAPSSTPSSSASEFHSVAMRVSDPQTLTIPWNGSSALPVSGTGGSTSNAQGAGDSLVFHLINARALSGVGCCPSSFKPSFAFHASNCSGLDCCRCSEISAKGSPPLPSSLDVVLTRLIRGACPASVRVVSVDGDTDQVLAPVQCEGEPLQAKFSVSPAPATWAILVVRF